jgi:hypothetical protein
MVDTIESLEETLESAADNALGVLVDEASSWPAVEEGEGLVGTTLAGLFYEEEAGRAPASEPGGETKPSPTGTGPEWPLQDDSPQPVSPFTPPVGSSFSLSGGQVGASIVALLLCVLASGLILLRATTPTSVRTSRASRTLATLRTRSTSSSTPPMRTTSSSTRSAPTSM